LNGKIAEKIDVVVVSLAPISFFIMARGAYLSGYAGVV